MVVSVTEKKCCNCKLTFPATEFNICLSSATGLLGRCKKCQKEYEDLARDWKIKKKKEGKCSRCGYNEDYRGLEFAHIDRSTKARNRKGKPVCMGSMLSIERLEKEWKLVKLLCKNCHRQETKEENDKAMEERKDKLTPTGIRTRLIVGALREKVNAEKLVRSSCLMCEMKVTIENFQCFDFDHRDPKDKKEIISKLVGENYPWEEIEAEMKKCNLLCARCHHIKSRDKGEMRPYRNIKELSPEEELKRYEIHPETKKRKLEQFEKKEELDKIKAAKKPKIVGETLEDARYRRFIEHLTEENKSLMIEHQSKLRKIYGSEFRKICKFKFSDRTFRNYLGWGTIDRYYKNNQTISQT